jgi:hypothetical protein
MALRVTAHANLAGGVIGDGWDDFNITLETSIKSLPGVLLCCRLVICLDGERAFFSAC